jgi:hydroxymethylpyrimidine pyrophosphatase-like HAD family hydrolase
MVATGRSELGVQPVLAQLAMDTPAVVFNGAGLYCPVERRLLEERRLSERVVARCFEFAARTRLLPVIQIAGAKFAPHPRDDAEQRALRGLEGLSYVDFAELPRTNVIRITFFSDATPTRTRWRPRCRRDRAAAAPHALPARRPGRAPRQRAAGGRRAAALPRQGRGLAHPDGALRHPPEAVVAVGDADNDLPMLSVAGLGVAMQNSMPRVLARAPARDRAQQLRRDRRAGGRALLTRRSVSRPRSSPWRSRRA